MGHKVYAAIIAAIKKGRLRQPFSSNDFRTACPTFADGTYSTFLAKHAIDNPGDNSELFIRVGRGLYKCIKPFKYGQ